MLFPGALRDCMKRSTGYVGAATDAFSERPEG